MTSAAPYGVNLLNNGDAEAGPFSTTGAPVATVPGWTTTSGFTVVNYKISSDTSGFPKTTNAGPQDRGNQFFAGGAVAASSASQDINVAANAADIDSGHVQCGTSAWLGGFADQDDQATFTVTFVNDQNVALASATIGPVTAADRNSVTGLMPRSTSVTVPPKTRVIRATVALTRKSSVGTYNDGYADSLNVTLYGPVVVTTTADAGPGSLREAISTASYVTFDPAGFGPAKGPQTITVETALAVTRAMTIVGPGAKWLQLRLDPNSPAYRILDVREAVVTIRGLAFSEAKEGALSSVGDLILQDCAFMQNTSSSAGGALFQAQGSLTVAGCTFSNNTARDGAAVYVQSGGGSVQATIFNSTFSNNSAANGGSARGGAINAVATTYVGQPTASVGITIDSCTFYKNNDTIGVEADQADTQATVRIRNSIFVTGTLSNFVSSGTGTRQIISDGYNLSDNSFDASTFQATGDRNNSNPRLDTLKDNGGSTFTHALLPGSPAIDKGNTSLAKDQRGYPRPVDDPNSASGGGNNSDIGAFEFGSGPTTLGNISTRLPVQTGDNVLIGGFIITGTQPKKVIIRAIGPSQPFPGVLANPTLELYSGNTLLESNDDWVTSANKQAIIDSTIPPSNNLESAIVRTLPANGANYTAVVRGANNSTGIALVEAYDLDAASDSKLANISTRGFVQTGDNILIAGMIILGPLPQKVMIRAIGPSLQIAGRLENPTLELRDRDGALLEANDNWVDSPNKQAIIDSTIPPTSDLESAIVRTLPANGAAYTAIVRGVNNATGIAIVEAYALQ